MRFFKWAIGLATKRTQNTNMNEPVSLAAFGQMSGAQQAMIAEVLVANQKERQGLKRAS